MQKITEKINGLPPDASFFSLEFFPPKTDIGLSNLQARLSRMSRALRPLFVTVTWGAGGSTSERSLELAEICQRQLGLTTCLHLTCTNMRKRLIDETLREAKAIGIRNILALRGDPPRYREYMVKGREDEYEGADEFVWAVDLVRYIRKNYGDYFCIGVAGYPEGHTDESNPGPGDQDPKHDMPYLVEKVNAGADFIMTQLFYDKEAYISYEKLVRSWDSGVLKDKMIIPGLMPIQGYHVLRRVTKLSHAHIPPDVAQQIEAAKGDDENVKTVGVDVLSSIIQTIKSAPSPTRRGFHFYTLNLEKVVSLILERCRLVPPGGVEDLAIDDEQTDAPPSKAINIPSIRRPSSPHNHIITDSSRSPASSPASRATSLAISHGVGSFGREATWDDYPNGRFGDARSPAFGEIDGYGPSLHLSPAAAREKWGLPKSRSDISNLFVRHLSGQLDQLPWSEAPLSAETQVIRNRLCELIEQRGWWSIASQPAADGVPSAHHLFGWGPSGGFVFQKAFVEFWIPERDWKEVLRPYLMQADIAPEVSWYAASDPRRCNRKQKEQRRRMERQGAETAISATSIEGEEHVSVNATKHDNSDSSSSSSSSSLSSSSLSLSSGSGGEFESSSPPDAANSVTWGCFPGKEIVTPTLIEEISFRAWADEAFGIWRQWRRCYPPASAARSTVSSCIRDMWLVNVIGHQYQQPERLWDILMAAGREGADGKENAHVKAEGKS